VENKRYSHNTRAIVFYIYLFGSHHPYGHTSRWSHRRHRKNRATLYEWLTGNHSPKFLFEIVQKGRRKLSFNYYVTSLTVVIENTSATCCSRNSSTRPADGYSQHVGPEKRIEFVDNRLSRFVYAYLNRGSGSPHTT